MKCTLLPVLMVAVLSFPQSALAEAAAKRVARLSEAPQTQVVLPSDGTKRPVDPLPATSEHTATAPKLKPGEALKVLLLQLLIAR